MMICVCQSDSCRCGWIYGFYLSGKQIECNYEVINLDNINDYYSIVLNM